VKLSEFWVQNLFSGLYITKHLFVASYNVVGY